MIMEIKGNSIEDILWLLFIDEGEEKQECDDIEIINPGLPEALRSILFYNSCTCTYSYIT